jgi:hypothetical protein
MAVAAMTPRYPRGVSRSNSLMRRIRDVAGVVTTPLDMSPIRLLTCIDGAVARRFVSVSGGLEIVGGNAVQKFFELLHLVLSDRG